MWSSSSILVLTILPEIIDGKYGTPHKKRVLYGARNDFAIVREKPMRGKAFVFLPFFPILPSFLPFLPFFCSVLFAVFLLKTKSTRSKTRFLARRTERSKLFAHLCLKYIFKVHSSFQLSCSVDEVLAHPYFSTETPPAEEAVAQSNPPIWKAQMLREYGQRLQAGRAPVHVEVLLRILILFHDKI